MNVLFFLSRKRFNQKKGAAPVYCRVSIKGRKKEFATGVFMSPESWNNGIVITKPEHEVLSAMLDELKAKILSVYFELKNRNKSVDPARVVKIITGKEDLAGILFSKLVNMWWLEELPRNKFSDSTLEKYSNYKKNLHEFLEEKGMNSILADEFTIPLAEQFRSWIFSKKECGKSHCSRHLRFCRDVLRYAVKMGHMKFNPLQEVELERDPDVPVIALTPEEINKVNNYRFSSLVLTHAWHLFLFQCYTGLSYGDLYTFDLKEENEMQWIYSPQGRNKNGRPYFVPLFADARQILEMYGGKLPFYTNQAYNRFLKEIAGIVGIDKHLTTHVARKTFAEMRDKEGWQLSAIARMMGNTESVVRKHYITGSKERILEEMTRLHIQA